MQMRELGELSRRRRVALREKCPNWDENQLLCTVNRPCDCLHIARLEITKLKLKEPERQKKEKIIV